MTCTGSRSSWRSPRPPTQPRPSLLERKREILAGRLYNSTKKAVGSNLPQNRLKAQIDPLVTNTAAKLAAEHLVSEKTVKRAGKFADEVAKAADTSTGTSGRAHGAVRWHYGRAIGQDSFGDARTRPATRPG